MVWRSGRRSAARPASWRERLVDPLDPNVLPWPRDFGSWCPTCRATATPTRPRAAYLRRPRRSRGVGSQCSPAAADLPRPRRVLARGHHRGPRGRATRPPRSHSHAARDRWSRAGRCSDAAPPPDPVGHEGGRGPSRLSRESQDADDRERRQGRRSCDIPADGKRSARAIQVRGHPGVGQSVEALAAIRARVTSIWGSRDAFTGRISRIAGASWRRGSRTPTSG